MAIYLFGMVSENSITSAKNHKEINKTESQKINLSAVIPDWWLAEFKHWKETRENEMKENGKKNLPTQIQKVFKIIIQNLRRKTKC